MANRVITGNINEEYRKATSRAVNFEGLPDAIQKKMKRKSVSGLTVDRVADQMYNPFLQTTEIEVPKDRKERNRWYRYFFLNEPIVHSALTLHTMFPLSSFRVSHEDKEIEDSFNEMIEDIRLFDFILEMGLEYWICCLPGTKILKGGGLEESIENLSVGDMVLTHKGTYQPIEEVMSRDINEDIYRIYVTGLDKPLEVTGNHPILALKREQIKCGMDSKKGTSCLPLVRCSNGFKYNCKKKVHDFEPKFTVAKDLTEGDYVTLNIDREYRREDRAFSKEWCRLFGYYLSEGCIEKTEAGEISGFCISNTDKRIVDEVLDLISNLVVEKIEVKFQNNCWRISCNSRMLGEDFLKHGGEYAKTKCISARVMRLNPWQQIQILSTFLNGDGSVDKETGTVDLYTTSETLANQLYFIALRCGMLPTISVREIQKYPFNRKENLGGNIYYISIHKNRETQIFESFKIINKQVSKENNKRFIYNKLLYSPIKKIEKVPYSGKVYNLRVAEDNTYIANKVIVHNCGEVFPFGFFDNPADPKMWTDFILLHPNFVEVEGDPWVRGKRKKHIWLTPTDGLKKIVEAGPNDPKTGGLYKNLPSDTIEGVKNGKMELGDVQVSHVKRPGMYFNTRGTSIIDCILKPLMYRDKLRSAQYALADRHISPSEFYFIGEQGDPADEDELEKFQNALVASWTQPNRAIIWHHAVRVEWQGASGKMLPLQPEFDMIDNQILIGLMVSKGVIFGEGPTFSNASVALDILIQRYLSFRMQIEKWIENCVFAPICKIHGLYKPTQAEIKHRIKIEGKDKPLWLPQVKWDKENLRDNMQKLDFMFRLADKGIVPWKMITDLLDFDWEKIKKGMDDQRKDLSKAGLPSAPKAPSGLSSLGLPIAPELGGGGAPGAVSPVGAGGLPTLPGAKPSPLEGGGPIPPESHVAPGIPVG